MSVVRRPKNPQYSPRVGTPRGMDRSIASETASGGHPPADHREVQYLRQQVLHLSEALQTQTLEIEKERNEWCTRLARDSDSFKSRREAMTSITDELRQQYSAASSQAELHREENDRLHREVKSLQQAVKQLEEGATRLRVETSQLQTTKDDTTRELDTTKSEVGSWRQRALIAENLVMEMKAEMLRCRGESETSRSKYDRLKQEFDAMSIELRRVSENEERLHTSVSEATVYLKDANQIRKEHCDLVQKCGEQQQLLQTLKMEKEFLIKHMGEGISERDAQIQRLRSGQALASSDETCRQLLAENTTLRSSLKEAMASMDVERSTTEEYQRVLVQRAEGAEAQANSLQNEVEILRAEVAKLRVERSSLEEERRRAVGLRDELERVLAEVRGSTRI